MRHYVMTGYIAIGYGCDANWKNYKNGSLYIYYTSSLNISIKNKNILTHKLLSFKGFAKIENDVGICDILAILIDHYCASH